jgi:NAD-dependent dihydropyrimidine dehydrogenase PreA subunit
MKGVSLRPARTPGTPRQWATLAVVLACALASLGLAWQWPSLLAAGPLHEGHAELDQAEKCSTCHVEAGWAGTPHLAMSAGCSTTDCHADVLKVKENVVDDCVSCHTDHRGRTFPIRGGETLCWSCHLGSHEARDYGTRPMRAAVATAPDEREVFLAKVARVETGLRFSHTAHDVETKGDARFDQCVGCHVDVDQGRTFALPSHPECIECHDSAVSADVEVAKKSPGPQCLECHTREDGETVEAPPRPFGFVEFAHRDHENEFCKSCHAGIWEDGAYANVVVTDLYPVAMDACYTCHQQKSATIACLDCHREHHSFPAGEVAAGPRSPTTLPIAFAGLVAFSLLGFGYVYTDMVLVRRWLRGGDLPPPAAPGGGGPAPAGEAPKGEILPFPRVDVEACISCSSCYNSCPKQVLAGDDHGKSVVVNPDACIALEGCAVCEQGCPTGAIRVSTAPLVRTVERPDTDEHLEAKPVPGLFFVGEVIGAALIKSAVNQGADVIRHIQKKKRTVAGADYDVIVVGAGPGGLGAALEAKSSGLRYLAIERDTIASTIRAYPRDKAVLAEPIKVPLYGKLPMMDAEKDELIAVWDAVVKTTGLVVQEHEEVTDVRRDGEVLVVKTPKGDTGPRTSCSRSAPAGTRAASGARARTRRAFPISWSTPRSGRERACSSSAAATARSRPRSRSPRRRARPSGSPTARTRSLA